MRRDVYPCQRPECGVMEPLTKLVRLGQVYWCSSCVELFGPRDNHEEELPDLFAAADTLPATKGE